MQAAPMFPLAHIRVFGVGVDICRSERLHNAYARRGPRLVQRLLTPAEQRIFAQRYAHNTERGLQFLTSRFAAKEALAKALGSGIRGLMGFQAASVLPDELGKPCIHTHGELTNLFASQGLRAHISLSDEGNHVIAYCLIEQGIF